MKSGKSYTKNLLLAATIISLSTTMPMNVAYANPTPTNGANASYTITAGTESNYNFKTTDGTNTQYWLINLTADKLNGQHVTFSSSNNGGTAINIALPNGKTQTLYYTYTRPTAPVNYDIVQNPTKDLGTIEAEGSWSVRPDPKSVYGVTNNESGSTISIENKTYQNNKLTASTNDRNVERLEYKYLTLNAGNVHNEGTIESITADFINNQVELNISNDNPAVEDNKNWHLCTYLHGGAIYNASNIGNITGDFIGNSVKINQTYEGVEHYADTAITRGGAIYTQGGSTIGNITGDFINNSAGSQGGAIYNFRGTIGNITGNAIGNSASEGGFIYNKGGGKNNKDAIIGDITGNIENNTGSAIYNEYGKIGNITGDFINNTSGYYGGVINNKTGEIKDITGDFINNTGTSGGAIANLQDYDAEGKIGNIHSNFISNTADKGGAIYNASTIESINGSFIENHYEGSSSPQGGALYTDGTLGDINADFIGNYAKSTSSSGTAKGGAIYAGGTVGDISGDFIGNYVSSNSHLNEGYGGAIYVAGEIGKKTGDEFTGTAISGNFINNSAVTGGGAIAISGYNAAVGDIAANFTNNTVYNDEDVWYGAHNVQGGAISIDNSYSSIKSITGNFTNNSAKSLSGAAYGGAIYNVGSLGTIKGNFSNNSVEANPYYADAKYNNTYALGGAIDSTADITLTDSSFTNNSAVSKNSSGTPISYSYGGAIYMSGGNLVINAVDSDVNFEGNSAYNGGAIYNNNSSKTITMNALNKDITFTNNNRTGLEDGFGYGIYTGGALNLNASDGKITINDQIYANGGININDGTTGIVKYNNYVSGQTNLKGGTLEVANSIGSAINLYDGTIKFSDNALTTTTSTPTYTLILQGDSILDMQNDTAGEVVTISNLSGSSELKFNADYDATANKMDKLTVNGGSGTITLNAVNVLNDNVDFVDGTQTTYLDGTARDNVTVITSAINSTTVTSDGKVYVFTPDSTTHGFLSVTRGISYEGDLINAIQDNVGTTHPTAYSMQDNFTANRNFGALNTDNREQFTIFGNNHTISGNNNTYTGIEVANGQTLNLDSVVFSNVKDYDVQNAGTLNLSGTNTIKTITGATGTTNIKGGTTTFGSGSSITQSAINMQGGRLIVNGSANTDIIGDANAAPVTTTTSDRYGFIYGGVLNYSGSDLKSISGSFNGNSANSTYEGDNPVDVQGGALFISGGITSGIDAIFTDNQATSVQGEAKGGALYILAGAPSVAGTYTNNKAISTNNSAYGGAIYNRSSVASGITGAFTSNSAISNSSKTYSNAYGGAIYTDGKTYPSSDIIDATFTSNSATAASGYALGGAVYTQGGTISGSTFTGNTVTAATASKAKGSAVYIDGNYNINTDTLSEHNVIGSTFSENGAGGVLYASSGHTTIKNSNFTNNLGDAIVFSADDQMDLDDLSQWYYYPVKGDIVAEAANAAITGNSGWGIVGNNNHETNSALTLYAKSGNITISGNTSGGINNNGLALTLNADTGYNVTIADAISSTTGMTVNAGGTHLGTVALNGDLENAGAISVGGGTLELGSTAVTSLANAIETNDGTVKLTGGTLTQNIAGATTISGTVINNNATLGNVTITNTGNFTDNGGAFTTADNAGTFNVNGVTLTAAGTSINNTNILNLTGVNRIKTITGATGITNITGGLTTIGTFSFNPISGPKNIPGSVTQSAINLKGGSLAIAPTAPATTINANIVGWETDDKTGTILNSGTINGTVSGTFKGNTDTALANAGGTVAGNVTANFVNNAVEGIYGGGAIYNTGTIGTVSGTFMGNSATNSSGDAYGGAIYQEGGTLTISNSTFGGTAEGQGNSATSTNDYSFGGAIYQDGGSLTIADSIFTGNKADKGGAIYGNNANITIYAQNGNVEFTNNNSTGTIDGTGTGIYIDGGSLTLNADKVSDTVHTITINDAVSSTTGMTVNDGGTHAGTVALNGALTLGGATNVQGGTLKLGTGAATSNLNAVTFANTPTLDLQNSSAQTTTVTSISGNANLNIDIDFTGESVIADSINIYTGGGSGVITLDSIAALSSDSDIKEFSNLAILTGETSGVTLALSDALQADTRFNGAAVETLTWESDYSDNVTFAKSVFTNTEYSETKQKQLSIVDGTKLSFAESTTIPKHATGNITTQDVLQALNQSTNAERKLSTDSATAVYTVGDDLGTTGAGWIGVEGVSGSNLNMDGHSGFELSNSNTSLYLGSLNVTNAKDVEGGLISITDENSYAELNGVTIGNTTNSVILNNGNLYSCDSNLGTGVTGTGTMTIIGHAKTTVGSIVQNSVIIDSINDELEVANITATNGISNAGTLTLTGTANANAISGTGHTTIAGNINNTGAINQAITVNGSNKLTTAANLIGGAVTNSGTVELTSGTLGQTITGGDITISTGEVTAAVDKLGGNITNTSTLLLSGNLNKTIAGTTGVTKLNDNMTFADGASIAGTLDFNSKAITMSGDNATTTFNVGKITSDGTINIDINTSGATSVYDAINLTAAGSTGTITINSINEIGARGDDFTLNILQGTTGSLQLALSDAVHSQFDQAAQHNLYYVSDAYQANIDFDKTSFDTTERDRVTQKAIGVEDNTKIVYTTNVISDTATGNVTQKDALAFINQNTDTSAVADRSMVTTDSNKTYTVQENLGTTGAGTLLVQGASDKSTILDMNNKTGFVVSNSGTTVTLKDINVNNVQNTDGALVNITNNGSSAVLDGATVNVKDNPSNKANVISSNGTLGVTNSTVNAGVNNDGTMNLNGTNQIASVEGSNGSANVQTGTTTVGSIFQKLINIVTGGKLASNGDVTATNGITNNSANGLSVANGTLTGNVTGSGTTDFKGTSAIADGSTVGQAITVIDGKLTTLAGGLGGAVTNGGEVDLTGGTLETSITGGSTTISGNVGVDDTAGSIASAVSVATGAKLTTKADNVTGAINNGGTLELTSGDIKNAISGAGTTTISGAVTNTTGSAIGNAVTVATTGSLTTAADKLGGVVENNATAGLTLTGGQLSQNVTGSGKTVIAGTDVSVKYGNSIAQDMVITSGNKLVNTNVTAIGGNVENNSDIQLYSQDNGKLEHNITGSGTTELNRDITVAANIDNAINIKSYTDAEGTHNANVTVESGNNFGKSGQNITVDSNNSLTMQSASDIKGNLVDNGTVELQGGTISNAISGTGDINITGNTINNVVNTVSGAVSVADNVELAVGTSGDAFASASSVTMGNNSTLNLQNNSATTTAINNLIVAAGDNVNVKMDWRDVLNSSSTNIAGTLKVTDVNLASTTGADDTYGFTNLGDKISLNEPLTLTGVTSSTNNFVTYDNTTGNLTSYRRSLVRAVDTTGTGLTATYVMTADETAGGEELDGALKVQGDGHTINTAGIKVGSATKTGADLTLENTNMNVAGKAVEVFGGNKATVDASGHDITLTTTDSSEVVSLNTSSGAYANAEFKGANTITVNGDIKSDDVNNTLTIASGATVNHAGLLDPITTNVSGTYNRTSGYDETVTYNVNAGGQLNFTNDTTLYDAGHHTAALLNTINFNGGSVNTINGVVTDFQLANMSLTGTTNNFYADVDLANQTMDKFTVANPVTGTGTLNVAGLNLISDAANVNTSINFTTDPVLMAAVNYTGSQGLTALSPIYKYNVGYDNTTGNFDFTRYNSGGYDGLNPAIMAAPVAAQLGGYLTQLNSYDEAFRNMDMYMLMTAQQRQALKNKNKVASIDGGVLYDATLMRQERAEGWFRPFATFEKVPLKNGPKVENIAYGTYMGGESEMYDLGHGWDGIWGAYLGYNGSHQNYDGVSIYQNGGTLGVLGMAYKGNFFTGLTINAGASGVEASTMYGNEDFAMLMAGIASKTGYNWELFNGKFIIQPSMLMSYSFVNTFDYKNAAGVNVDSDPLHAIQLQPEIKFIGNLKNGWQPYASVAMVWNIMDNTKFKANDVSLPELSVKPYVKYGVGVRKTWGERLTGFFQTYLTNGGRNGVGLQAGFTWAFGGGKDKKADEKKIQKSLNKTPELKKTEIVLNGKKVQ